MWGGLAACGRLSIGLLAMTRKLGEADCQSAAGCQPAPHWLYLRIDGRRARIDRQQEPHQLPPLLRVVEQIDASRARGAVVDIGHHLIERVGRAVVEERPRNRE